MTSYRYGYARVSTTDQDPALQVDALHAAGVEPGRVFVDFASGALATPPQLEQLRNQPCPGNTFRTTALSCVRESAPDPHSSDV